MKLSLTLTFTGFKRNRWESRRSRINRERCELSQYVVTLFMTRKKIFQGSPGLKGERGQKGDAGKPGAKGKSGSKGTAGIKGEKVNGLLSNHVALK